MEEDYDRSLDDIIKQRNIRSNAGGVKSGGGAGGGMKSASMKTNRQAVTPLKQMKPKMKFEDARHKLLMNQRVKIRDARDKLNQKARMTITDAREKLNRLGMHKGNALQHQQQQQVKVQKAVTIPRFKQNNQTAIRLTRTVNNRALNQIRQNAKTRPALLTSSGGQQGVRKKVFLTESGLTVNTLTRPTKIPSPGNLFARTVNSLTQDAVFQSGHNQEVRNPIYQRKRKLVKEEDDFDDMDYSTVQNTLDTKRLKFLEESEQLLRPRGTAMASKISPGLQSRLGDADAGVPLSRGFKLLVSNLHAIVTQQDLVELFGDVGPLRKVHFVRPGVAEVSFVDRLDAQKAIENYHNRELDGQPMICKLDNPSRLASNTRPISLTGSSGIKVGTLRSDHVGNEARVKSRVAPDLGVIHKALFHKTSTQTNRASIVVTM